RLIPMWVALFGSAPPALPATKGGAAAVVVAVFGSIAALVLTVWIWIRFSLAAPAVILEGAGPIAALRRSWQLVRGSWWRVFGISLLALLDVILIGLVLQVPFLVVRLLVGGGRGFTP